MDENRHTHFLLCFPDPTLLLFRNQYATIITCCQGNKPSSPQTQTVFVALLQEHCTSPSHYTNIKQQINSEIEAFFLFHRSMLDYTVITLPM